MNKLIIAGLVGAVAALAASRVGALAPVRKIVLEDARECAVSDTKLADPRKLCTPGARIMLTLNDDGSVTWSDWK